MIDGRHVHESGLHADAADVSRLQLFGGGRVGAKQLGLYIRRDAPTAAYAQGDDPVPVPELAVGVDFPPWPSHRHVVPRKAPLDRGRREGTRDRQHVADPEVPRIHHLARVNRSPRRSAQSAQAHLPERRSVL
ncbi:hypothetical protein GCM10010449_06240 [Streptomyces rectiviolaceus]|uniref:Uncharacterized protein n=1 Tax=Streptomyces rectiviolaceus TaxID=332591 RepID=A0ABP6M714_9ACTN